MKILLFIEILQCPAVLPCGELFVSETSSKKELSGERLDTKEHGWVQERCGPSV